MIDSYTQSILYYSRVRDIGVILDNSHARVFLWNRAIADRRVGKGKDCFSTLNMVRSDQVEVQHWTSVGSSGQ